MEFSREEWDKKVTVTVADSHPGVYTVLHSTCLATNCLPLKIVQLFIRGGADPNAKGDDGDTPLHYVAFSEDYGNVSATLITKLLLSVGAHLDQGNNECLPKRWTWTWTSRMLNGGLRPVDLSIEVH